jgi:hypothetical protein
MAAVCCLSQNFSHFFCCKFCTLSYDCTTLRTLNTTTATVWIIIKKKWKPRPTRSDCACKCLHRFRSEAVSHVHFATLSFKYDRWRITCKLFGGNFVILIVAVFEHRIECDGFFFRYIALWRSSFFLIVTIVLVTSTNIDSHSQLIELGFRWKEFCKAHRLDVNFFFLLRHISFFPIVRDNRTCNILPYWFSFVIGRFDSAS